MTTQAEIEAQIARSKRYTEEAARARKEICSVCEGELVYIWNGQDRVYQLKCGRDKTHVGTKSAWQHSVIQERNAREVAYMTNQALTKYSGSVALDKAEAEDILLSLWPDAPKTEVYKAALICKQYGLNPLMRHLYLIKYERREKAQLIAGEWRKGKVIGEDWSIQIGIGATRMIARRSGAYSYEDDTPRLMTEEEQVKILGAVEKDKYWAITRLRGKDGMTAQGYGQWPKGDAVKGADKGNSPQNMAMIRSERAALDKLFPEKLPAGVEVVDTSYTELPSSNGSVDPGTGEITESPAIKPAAVLATPAEVNPAPAASTLRNTETRVYPATGAQWDEIRAIGKQQGWTIADACAYVGTDMEHLLSITVAQANDILKAWREAAKANIAKQGRLSNDIPELDGQS